MGQPPIVTITTDFGIDDHFVGTMKGVILNINPSVQFVDICHRVNSYDILDGALTLALSYRFFPGGAIHLVVVDPGVGSSRRPIAVRSSQYTFVAPDNGVLSFIFEREAKVEVRHVTASQYFLQPLSNTFHGRDIFAPVAGWLSKGVAMDQLGAPITDYVKIAPPRPKRVEEGRVEGVVLKVDKFGNLITNLAPEDLPELLPGTARPFRIAIHDYKVTRLYSSYSMGQPSELFAIWGSSGYLEVCRNLGSAASALQASQGSEVKVAVD
ncbi:MAG: SAM hydrolase/SAM-dependent halogenase family protein [Terriglobia bacterium]